MMFNCTGGTNYVCAVYRLIKSVPESSGPSAIVTFNGKYKNNEDIFKWDVDLSFKVFPINTTTY